ncbi:MAG: hypothetical protein Q9222_005954 [Ikaeria aurantiellina]
MDDSPAGRGRGNPPSTANPPFKPKRTAGHFLYSLWLFTFSDLKTIILPKTFFGVATLCSGQGLTKNAQPEATQILSVIPSIIIWTWINLLPLTISNQLDTKSIKEDSMNKPWRPIAAGRLSLKEARTLMVCSYAVAIFYSLRIGGLWESVALIVEGLIYNGLDAANDGLISRNMLNAIGYMTFASGAANVACMGCGTEMREGAAPWFIMLGAVIATTIQFQDLYDQQGDFLRGRRTLPLIVGDQVSRLTIAFPLAIWFWVCPRFWGLTVLDFPLPAAVLMAFRLFRYRSIEADKKSFLVWNVWVMSLYFLSVWRREV